VKDLQDARDWIKISLTPAQSGDLGLIMNACFPLFVAAGFPEDAAVFARMRPRLGAELFFSPRMAAIAHSVLAAYDTVATEPPTRAGTTVLIASSNNAFAMLSP
jgi:hypothetical protein